MYCWQKAVPQRLVRRDRRISASSASRSTAASASATCSPSARAICDHHPQLCDEDAHAARTTAADHRTDARRAAKRSPRVHPCQFAFESRPRAGRLRLQRRRPAQPRRTPLPAQTQPHQPFRGRIPRLPLRGADTATVLRSLHAPRTPNGAGPRAGIRLGAVRPNSGPCSGPSGHFGELGLIGGCIYVGDRLGGLHLRLGGQRPHLLTSMSKRPTRSSTAPSRSSTSSSPSTSPSVSRSSTARRTSDWRACGKPNSPTTRHSSSTSSRRSACTPTSWPARICG